LLARIDALGPIVEDSRAASRKKKIIAAIKSGNATKILTDTTFNNGKFFNKAIDTEWLNIINDIRAYATALATQDVHHRNQ
ncbi:MAG: hypothetical protein QGF46_08460, partial [Planctomycetota bacterium]|nr:hypothetical protein [Planctomycetota bacterium]